MDIRKTLAGASAALVAFSQIATGIATAATFSDVTSSHWAYSYVEQLVEDGVIDSADNFRPDDNLNRAELVKIALMAAGIEIDTEGAPSFSDVAASAWYYPYVATAAKLGIVGGYTDASGNSTGKFGPADVVNRAAATKILINAYGIAFDLTPASMFSDVKDTTAWFYPYVVTAYNQSIVDGYSNGKFGPNDAVTRAQIAKITVNAANPSERVDAEDEEETTPVEMGDGELSVEISDKTPSSATLPKGAEGVPAAAFDFTASNADDVKITALQIFRSGLGNDDTLSAVALFDKDGNRISKAKTFTTSEDLATVSILNGGITVKAGKTITLYARVNVGSVANQQFALALKGVDAITSNAADVSGDFPVVGETMETGGVAAAELFIQSDGVPSSVKLGETDVEISKFKVKNNDNSADITLYGITLKEEGSVSEDTDLANYKLYVEGKVVATAETSNDKYVTLMFDEPMLVKSAKTLKASLHADIIGGANKYINFQVDNSLDVVAIDEQYGYGPDVDADGTNVSNTSDFNSANDGSTSAKRVAVEAGELAIVAMDAANTDIRQNKKDTVLGTLKVTVNAGQALELQKLKVQIANTDATNCGGAGTGDTDMEDVIENVEVYTGTSVYDLGTEAGVTGCTATYEDSDLSIVLADTETYELQIRADIRNVDQTGGDLDMSTVALEVSIDGIGNATKSAAGLYVIETDDDQVVTDVTPSSVTFKTLTGRESTTTINTIVQSATKNAVIGTKGVEVLEFEAKAGNASDLYVTRLSVKGTAVNNVADNDFATGSTVADNTRVNKATLYLVDGSTMTELDSVSGSQFSSGVATFDGFREKIVANSTARFLVTVDIINDINQGNDTLNFELTSITMEDDDSDDVATGTVNGGAETLSAIGAGNAASARTITISGTGTLTATVDTTDSETDSAKWVLGNTTYKYVASYELTAQNEGVEVKDISILETSGGALKNAVAEVIVYDAAGTEIARKTVSSDTVLFTDIDYTVDMGSENLYIGVVAHKQGKDQAGVITDGLTLELVVTEAEGAESGKVVNVSAIDQVTEVGDSLAFGVIPTIISNVEYVSSYSGTSVATELTTGQTVIGILKVTTESSSNNSKVTGASLKTDLTKFNFTVSTDAAPASFVVERIGGTGSDREFATTFADASNDYVAGTLSSEEIAITLGSAGTNNQIENGTSAYYAIKANGMTLGASSKSCQVIVDLSADISYDSDDDGATGLEAGGATPDRTNLRLDTVTLNLPQVTYKP